MNTEINLVSGYAKSLTSIGPLGFSIKEDGEIVDDASIKVGYGYRGTEQLICQRSFLVGAAYADRIDFVSPQSGSFAFSRVVERLSGITVPRRGQMIRVLLLEMSRISSHLYFIATMAKEINLLSVYHFCLREREKFNDLFELYCGSRLGFGCIQVGGVKNNISEGLIDKIELTIREVRAFLDEVDSLLIGNPLFRARLKGLAPISLENVNTNNISGPTARASGSHADLRVDSPYSLYDEIEVPELQKNNYSGDALGRVLIRIDEISQSMEIVENTLAKMSLGNHKVELGMNFMPPKGNAYTEIESPRGRFGVYVESEGGLAPTLVRFIPPSHYSLRITPWLLREEMVEDVGIMFASLDISVSEVDR